MLRIRLENAAFRFAGAAAPVWRNVTLEIHEGERVLLTGPSGSGKSTLLGVMAGLIPRLSAGVLEGSVLLDYGTPALVLQNPEAQAVTPTVIEEIAFALENRGMPADRIRGRVREVLSVFAMNGFENRKTATLSGGEAQRLSLACAFAQEPDILFLDEPCSYLDPRASSQFYRHLTDRFSSTTVVMIEHETHDIKLPPLRTVELTPNGIRECGRAATAFERRAPEPQPDLFLQRHGTGETVLSLADLSHEFPGGTCPLKGLNAEFRPGRIAAVLGPSGAGKSTLLKKIAGALPVKPGTVFLNGIDQAKKRGTGVYRNILYIPQNPEHFFLRMTVRDELRVSSSDETRIREAAGFFGLPHDSPLHPCALSEGEKRRLTLTLALLDPRPVILLDEPSYGLDRRAFSALIGGLRALKEDGRTIVLVTHSPELVRSCADDVWYLDGGTLSERRIPESFSFEENWYAV